MIKLRPISIKDEALFKEQSIKFLEDDFSFAYNYDPAKPFEEYLQYLKTIHKGKDLIGDAVPGTMLIAENEKGEIVGRTSFRHRLNDYLSRIGGHIGYGVLKEYRKKGYGSEILKETLVYVKENFEIDKVLVTCDETNIGSIKVIENNEGVFESTTNDTSLEVQKHRYWIKL